MSPQFRSGGGGGMQTVGYEASQLPLGVGVGGGIGVGVDSGGAGVGVGVAVGAGLGVGATVAANVAVGSGVGATRDGVGATVAANVAVGSGIGATRNGVGATVAANVAVGSGFGATRGGVGAGSDCPGTGDAASVRTQPPKHKAQSEPAGSVDERRRAPCQRQSSFTCPFGRRVYVTAGGWRAGRAGGPLGITRRVQPVVHDRPHQPFVHGVSRIAVRPGLTPERPAEMWLGRSQILDGTVEVGRERTRARGGDVLLDLIRRGGADEDGGHVRVGEQVAQRELDDRQAGVADKSA